MKKGIFFILGLWLGCGPGFSQGKKQLPDWAMGPFSRPPLNRPIMSPDSTAVFSDPMSRKPVHWSANAVFNPAAIATDKEIIVLYRAEDKLGENIIGGHTSRIGYAGSTDGIHFRQRPEPVLYPADDNQKIFDWPGGCEDPRVVQTREGLYVMHYTSWNKDVPRLSVATSRDLLHWEKRGPAFQKAWDGKFANIASKSAAVVTVMEDGKLAAYKKNGKYLMYWGERFVNLATSEDLVNWEPMLDSSGALLQLISPRDGYFDSDLTECGPPALVTSHGILLLYNGKNKSGAGASSLYTPNAYCAGQVLFSLDDPSKAIARLDHPFLIPSAPYEKSGQYTGGTVFIEGLVLFRKKWYLYYGCADSHVAVAVFEPPE